MRSLDGLVSEHYVRGVSVRATYYRPADYKSLVDFAKRRMVDQNRAAYNILTNSCKTFANVAIAAGLR
jgi:hypothetical protein